MKFTDTAPTLPRPDGPPPWLGKLAKDASLEGAVLKHAVHGRDNILTLISYARTLYEFQEYTYYGNWDDNFFMEAYRSRINGVPVDCFIVAHMNDKGEADSILLHHYPLNATLEFSRLMWEKFGDRFGDLYLSTTQADGVARASNT
jgi:hypothetical protein